MEDAMAADKSRRGADRRHVGAAANNPYEVGDRLPRSDALPVLGIRVRPHHA